MRHQIKREEDQWVNEMLIEGILLRATCAKQGEFSRIGSFNYYKGLRHGMVQGQNSEELYEPFLRLLGDQGKTIAREVCAEIVENFEHPDHRYVITII